MERTAGFEPAAKTIGGCVGGWGAVAGEEEDVINKKKAAEIISVGKN